VAAVSVALAKRLGFSGTDLDAIEIGALLHDVGKIGVPERILQKESALDDDEWEIMRQHPLLSEYILAEVDLPPSSRRSRAGATSGWTARGTRTGWTETTSPCPHESCS